MVLRTTQETRLNDNSVMLNILSQAQDRHEHLLPTSCRPLGIATKDSTCISMAPSSWTASKEPEGLQWFPARCRIRHSRPERRRGWNKEQRVNA